jgi:ubiquinone/menaquinone biosynthesis C-methylase UbiE
MTTAATQSKPKAAPASTAQPNLDIIKTKQQAAWASGDYAHVGVTLQIVGEALAEAVDLRSGERVLDVAAGNGNASLAAARRFARVTSTDYVEHLLDKGRERAAAERLSIEFQVADAENLPFDDSSFDVALSTYGVMFTPNQERAASELLRVVRPGGRIGLANWTPEGFIGQLFKVIGRHVPPAPGAKPSALWGTEPRLVELFGTQAADIRTERKVFNFRYESVDHWIGLFRTYYGPVLKAFEALDAGRQAALHADLAELLTRLNQGGDRSLLIPGEYLEIVVTKD